jgi:hypothetical protein
VHSKADVETVARTALLGQGKRHHEFGAREVSAKAPGRSRVTDDVPSPARGATFRPQFAIARSIKRRGW